MKRISSLLVCLGIACCALAQDTTSTPTVSGGFIGAGGSRSLIAETFRLNQNGNGDMPPVCILIFL